MPNILTIVFLLALALQTALSIDNNQEISPLKFGDTISLELVQQETRFFTFTIPKLQVDKDLLIFARPRGYSNDPDLFLSTKNQHPTTALESDYSSQALGFSSINLPNEELEENVPYYLGVKCSTRTCSLNLTLKYQSDIYMEAERELIALYYIKEKTQIIRAYVPEDSTIEHILFATEVQGQLDEQIYMYVNKGNETPDTVNYNVKSFIGWKDGKAAGVFKGDPNFCTGCNYTIAVEAPRDTILLFSRKVYGPTRNLEVNTAGSNDALSRDANITYKVNLTTVTHAEKIPQFLTVQVTPYLGSLSTYVNFNEIPGDLKDSDYYIRHHSSERIEIDLVKLSSEGNLPEVIYVTVFGRSYSNFHIKVFTSDQDSILLIPGEFEFGTAKPDNVSNFLASVYSSGLFDMSIDVHADQGTVAVFVKRCLDKETCKFDNTEVTKILQGTTPTTTKDPLLLYTNVTHIDDYIEFSMDGTVCGTINDPLCIFAVGVTPINERSPVNFTVAAVLKGEPRALKVNTPSRESIRMNDYSYYYFTVGNDENIEEVSFQITEISGAVFVYISREERYPDSRNHERPTRYNDLYSFDKEKFPYLNGTYYIAVTTLNSATYSILAKVRYANKDNNSTGEDDSANSTHILQLEQEVPQKITIQPGETSYFKFAVRQQEDDLEGVDILLTDVRGQLTLCVRNDGQLPQKDFCQWNATNNTLEISPTDPLFKADATYIVAVQSVNVAESHVSNAFVIGWTKFSSFKILDAGSIDGTVTKDYPQFYKIEVYPEEDREIVIGEHTTSIADFVDLFVFNSRPGKNTNYRESANKTKVITEGELIIDSSSISQLCTPASSRVVSKFCVLYIVITTNSANEVKFNLALMKEPESIKIKDNTQTMIFFPAKYSPVHLYYYPSQRKDIIINVFSVLRKVRVYANIIDTDNYASLNKWPFPTEAKNEFASLSAVHPSVELHIPAYAMSACGAYGKAFTCAVALTVDYDEPSSASPSQPNTFFVFASQEVIPIVTGRPYTSSIEPSQIKYYSLDVSKTQATLLVSVVCLTHCSNQVLIAKGADARPTPFGGYVQLRSVATSEVIQISDVEAPGNSMKGTWIIGVTGNTNATFVLEVAFEEQKILTLFPGTPVEAAVPENQTLSFLYFHAPNNALNFRVTREKGAGKYWIAKVNSSQTIEQNIASESHSVWSGSFSYSQDVIKIDPSDTNFCNFCKYLLTVAAEKDMKFSIVAYGKDASTWLKPESIIRDYVDSSNPIRYIYSGTHDFLDLNILIYSGEISVYVQTGSDVNETDYTWKRTASSGTKYIRLALVNPEDPSSTENYKNTHDTYNVLVTSSVPTNYSIGISFSNSTSFLYEGRQIFGFLNPKEMNNYMYFEGGGASSSPLKVQFVMYRDQFSILMNETERFPDFKFLHLVDDTTNVTVPEVVNPFRNDIMRSKEGDLFYRQMLQYTQLKQGHYKFVVTNNYDIGHFNYSLAVNSNAPLELPLNTIYASRTAVGKNDLYIVHTGQPGTVVVEVHKCVGNVDILISNNHAFEAPVSSELGNVEENTLGSHIVFMTFSLEKAGSVYIKVTAIDGVIDDDLLPQKEAVYKIKADFYDAEKSSLLLPYKWFTAGKDGNLMWSFEGHDIQVEFDDVNYLQSNQVSSKYGQINFTHSYDLFMTKDIMPAQYLSRCDMMPKREGSFKNMNMKASTATFKEDAINSNSENANHKVIKTPMEIEPNPAYITLRVTLSGTNKEGDHIWSYPIIYQTTMVSGKIGDTGIPEVNMRGLMTLIVVICVLIVVAVGVTYYYYSRYRRVKQILNYEVQDMSSLGGVESEDGYQERGIELGKMKYSGLPEQAE